MGTVHAFRERPERATALTTVYLVVCYWRDRTRLVEGRLQQFANMELALRAGAAASAKAAGVVVCRVRGNAEADYWEDPVRVARWGDVPDQVVQ